jgi:putative oxygen-independent coproporphyrinogen III oxidase
MNGEQQAVRVQRSPFTVHSSLIPPPLSLYVHIPWCVKKCPYCDFNSHALRGELPEADYVNALIADLEHALPRIWGRRVHTIFFGGGTPSLLSADAVERLLSAIRARVPLDADAEVTLEANPGTFEAEKFAGFRAAGINRLSIGVQSFNPRHLQALGRIHDGEQARRAIDIARERFDNINLDLMYALPGQSSEDVAADIETALAFSPAHISAYHLTIEPNTFFYRYPPKLPEDDAAAEMQSAIESELAHHGFEHYETSAFARPNSQCRHNLNYWRFGDYLGIGAGAHSKISFAQEIVREMRWKQPAAYMENASAGNPIQERHEITDRPFEFMMNALRLNGGFATRLFEERTGMPLASIVRELDHAEEKGLLTRDHRWIAPTALGRRFLNDLLQIFLPR